MGYAARVQSTIQALAEPRRREILALIRDRELSAGEIASGFDVTRPAISQHLGVLKEAGLVSERREGTKRFYRARPEGLRELKEFLEGFWTFSLAQLKREAEAEERKKRGSQN
jgi:DNA-binding transcriptional ArsR family regulator